MALQALEIIKSPKITIHFQQLLGIKKSIFGLPQNPLNVFAQNFVTDQQSMPPTSGQNLVHLPSIAFRLDKKSGLSKCQV